MPPETLSLGRLNRATLARQMLLGREERVSSAEAVRRLGGMQAQEPKPPFLGLWSRLENFSRADLRTALGDRSVVRATAMRATLHLLSTEDYVLFRATLQPVLTRAMSALGSRAEGLRVDEVLPTARALLQERPHGFEELRASLAQAFPDVNERALGFAVRMELPLVMVPTDDRWSFPSAAAFALADTWLAGALPGDPAPEALVRRYLGAFGPATAADAQTWSGLTGMKGVVERMRPELEVFADQRGRELFDLPDAPRPDEDVPAPVRFLPEFDSLVLAHADRTRVIAEEHRESLVTKNLRVRATFLWDGYVAGTWKVERRRKTATLHVSPFQNLPKRAAKELSAEGEALLRFAEEDATTFAVKLGESGASLN